MRYAGPPEGGAPNRTIRGCGAGNQSCSPSGAVIAKNPAPGVAGSPVTPLQNQQPLSNEGLPPSGVGRAPVTTLQDQQPLSNEGLPPSAIMPGPEKRVLDLTGVEREVWLVDVGKKAKAGVDRGLMLAGQVRPEEEAGGVAAKPASDHEGEKAEAAAGGVAAKPASDHEGEKAEAVAGATANTGKKDLTAIQRTNREDFVALALQKDEVMCFYSTEVETRLFSFCGNYPFWGTDIELGTTLGFLEGHLSKKFFKTREHFFQFCKCIHVSAGEGVHSGAAAAMAIKLLRGTALEAKRATNKGSVKGLDVAAWDEVKGEVMAVAALQQARGCSVFGAFLDGTGDALLAETNSFDSWWGLGMGMAQAVQTPKEARNIAWGRNEHGVALMLAREARRRGDG